MIAYLKTVENGQDEIAVRRILNVPRRGIGQTTIGRISDYALSRDITFFEAMCRCRNITSLGRASSKIESFVSMILEMREFAQGHDLPSLLRHIIEVTDYESYLRDSDDEDGDDRISNVDELVSKITDYAQTAEEPTLSGFLEEVALVADIDETQNSQDKVLLMTLHSAKGLEFSHVYITGMEENVFPSAMALNSEDDEAEAEERRLAYVGITRAKDDLTLTSCTSRMNRGEVQYNPMSRFVTEIPQELFDREGSDRAAFGRDSFGDEPFGRETFGRNTYGRETFGQRSYDRGGLGGLSADSGAGKSGTSRPRLKAVYRKPSTDDAKKPYIAKASGGGKSLSSLKKGMPSAPSKPDYQIGDRVHHVKYGAGTVKELEPGPRDYKVTVVFDDFGQKIMYAAFAKLVRI